MAPQQAACQGLARVPQEPTCGPRQVNVRSTAKGKLGFKQPREMHRRGMVKYSQI